MNDKYYMLEYQSKKTSTPEVWHHCRFTKPIEIGDREDAVNALATHRGQYPAYAWRMVEVVKTITLTPCSD